MEKRRPFGSAGSLLFAVLLAAFVCDVAAAQTRWPPWQTYSEAEKSTRDKQKRRAIPAQSEIDAANKSVDELSKAGKSAEAIAAARRALSLTESRYGRDHAATAAALTRLAELLIAQKKYADAEPLLKRALAIREKSKDAKSEEIAQSLDRLGELYGKQGRAADADALKKRSAALRAPKEQPQAAKPGIVATQPAVKDGEREAQEKAAAEAKARAAAEAKRKADDEAEAMRAAEEARFRAAEAEAKARAEEEARRAAEEASQREAEAKAAAEAPRDGKPAADGTTETEIGEALERRPMTRGLRRAKPSAAAAPPPPAPEPDVLARKSGGGGGAAPETMEAPAAGPASTEEPVAPTATAERSAEPPAPSAGPAAAAPEEKWDVVPVFFGTDRAEEANPKRLSYGSDRGRRLDLGRALVTVPKLHEVPQVERPWAIRIPYFNVTIYEEAEDPNKHFTMQELKKLSKEDLLRLVRERLAGSSRFKDQALVFVHGYNTSFDNAVYRTAQIVYDLKFDGAPFLYSWPSGGAVASYTYDRESAEASKPHMRQFLEMVVKETGTKAVSIIAHSMGNQPLLDVLKDMRHSAPEGVAINQVILAAPDVDADSFSVLAQAIGGLAKGVTLYAASNDRALLVSRRFWGNYRAGDVPAGGPLVLPGIDTIDVTAASTDVFALNHSEYAQNTQVLDDIAELIETGKRPPEERNLKPERVTTDHGAYWRYVVHPSSR